MAKNSKEPISSSDFTSFPATGPSGAEPTASLSRAKGSRETPAGIARSMAAFRRDLAKLLDDHAGEWVAYHHEDCVAFGPSKTQLYKECLSHYGRGEFVVEFVEPEDTYTEYPTIPEDRS